MKVHNTINPSDYDKNSELRSKVWTEYTEGHQVIGIDLDESILATVEVLLNMVNERCGTKYTLSDVVRYDMVETLGLDLQMFLDILHNSNYLSMTKPFEHTKEFIRKLRDGELNEQFNLRNDQPVYLAFITHRGFRSDGFKLTHDVLVESGLIPDMLIVCPVGHSKLDILDDLFGDNVQLIIEDQPKILNDFTQAGIQTVKNLRPWNKDHWTDYTIDLTCSPDPIFA